jgi:solute:Na+ symporter, SSS family
VLSSSSRHVIRRNAALLPAYTFLLGLIALLGFIAIAAGVGDMPQYKPFFAQYKANFAVPALLLNQFPAWFVGFAFAAIGIGALVPAAIMSIAASNLWTRNIYKEFINAGCSPKQEAQMAKWVSLVVKFGALVFVLGFSSQYAIYLQLLGGVWIIQTLPAVVLGLYTRWLNHWALLIGWAVGIVSGTWMAASVNFAAAFPLHIGGITAPGYIAVWTLILNLVVTIVLTAIFNAMGAAKPRDETAAADYV